MSVFGILLVYIFEHLVDLVEEFVWVLRQIDIDYDTRIGEIGIWIHRDNLLRSREIERQCTANKVEVFFYARMKLNILMDPINFFHFTVHITHIGNYNRVLSTIYLT